VELLLKPPDFADELLSPKPFSNLMKLVDGTDMKPPFSDLFFSI
jgi:hypothetical protein